MTVLERLEALRTEATPGEWYAVRHNPHNASMLSRETKCAVSSIKPANAALIVETHNALPALLRIARAAELFIATGEHWTEGEYAELRSALSDLEANT